MVPNMLHCAGGTGGWAADYVAPMVEWVERGKAPEAIVGTNPGITNWFEALAVIEGVETVDWYRRVMQAGEAKDPSHKVHAFALPPTRKSPCTRARAI